jgi:LmbE family N-acetylglucosaminyl deacetylase
MTRHLFLSPHLDDAILSCGGFMRQLSTRGEPVTSLTIMAGDPPAPLPDTPLVRELHDRWSIGKNPVAVRRDEDRRAMRIVGAEARVLDIPDCIYRTADDGAALYVNGDADLFGDVHPNDPARDALARQYPPEIETVSHLYIPLGAGHHVDHQLIVEWGLALAKRHPQVNLLMYTDYPYAEDEGAVQRALEGFPLKLTPEIKILDAADFAAKAAAIREYQSQISTFWATAEAMTIRMRQFMLKTGDGQLAERYWRARS